MVADEIGHIPLHCAVMLKTVQPRCIAYHDSQTMEETVEVVRSLLGANKAGSTAFTKSGELPIHLALLPSNKAGLGVVIELLGAYKDGAMEGLRSPNKQHNCQHRCPLHLAIWSTDVPGDPGGDRMERLEILAALLDAYPAAINVSMEISSTMNHTLNAVGHNTFLVDGKRHAMPFSVVWYLLEEEYNTKNIGETQYREQCDWLEQIEEEARCKSSLFQLSRWVIPWRQRQS